MRKKKKEKCKKRRKKRRIKRKKEKSEHTDILTDRQQTVAWVGGRLTAKQTSAAQFYAFFSLREKKEDTNRDAIKRDEINRDKINREAPALMRPTIWVKKVLRM